MHYFKETAKRSTTNSMNSNDSSKLHHHNKKASSYLDDIDDELGYKLFDIDNFDDYFKDESSKKSLKNHSTESRSQIAVNGQRMGLMLPKVIVYYIF